MVECRRFEIYGRVQGVWFRDSTRRQAEALELRGQALNRSDGSVEVIACGAPAALEQLAEWLQQGPPRAEVERVVAHPYSACQFDGFTTG
ncbi:MAG: acylphosphatase [Wenzhouxiangellaceae bacterium]